MIGHLGQLFDVYYVKKIWFNKKDDYLFHYKFVKKTVMSDFIKYFNKKYSIKYFIKYFAKQNTRTSNKALASKAQKVQWAIDVSWFMQESFGLNSNWSL